jgi:hypothetical protein
MTRSNEGYVEKGSGKNIANGGAQGGESMKLKYKGDGANSIFRIPIGYVTIKKEPMEVPDVIAWELLKSYPSLIERTDNGRAFAPGGNGLN